MSGAKRRQRKEDLLKRFGATSLKRTKTISPWTRLCQVVLPRMATCPWPHHPRKLPSDEHWECWPLPGLGLKIASGWWWDGFRIDVGIHLDGNVEFCVQLSFFRVLFVAWRAGYPDSWQCLKDLWGREVSLEVLPREINMTPEKGQFLKDISFSIHFSGDILVFTGVSACHTPRWSHGRKTLHKTAEIYGAPDAVGHTLRCGSC